MTQDTDPAAGRRECRRIGRHSFPSGEPAEQPRGTTEYCARQCGVSRTVSKRGMISYGFEQPGNPAEGGT